MGNIILFGRLIFFKEESANVSEREIFHFIDPDFNINALLKKGGKAHLTEGYQWRFAGVKTDEQYIYGKLGKESGKTELRFDDKTKDYIESKDTKAYVMHFLIDLSRHIIAYESKKDIGEKMPMAILSEMVRLTSVSKVKLTIETITDKRAIIERMKGLSHLNRVELTVYRTNPESTSGSDKMDRFLREGHIKRLKLTAHGDERGIQLKDAPFLKSGLHLAEEGYGTAKAVGKAGTRRDEILTGDMPMKSTAQLGKDEEKNRLTLVHEIKELLRKLEAQL